MRGFALCLTLAVAGALGNMPGSAAAPAAVPAAQLKAISARSNPQGASLVIEASEPVPYLTARPDPLTVVVDFRNVTTDGLANSVAPASSNLIAGVTVEHTEAIDAPAGTPVTRVRIALASPVAHVVRSDRNTVVVEFSNGPAARRVGPRDATRNDQSPLPDAMQALLPQKAPENPLTVLAQGTNVAPASNAGPSYTPGARPEGRAYTEMQAQAPAPPTQAAQGPAPTLDPQTVRPGQRVYTGHPVTLDFQQADLRLVLRAFNEISGLNIVIDPTVQGSVDVALRDVPWDQALDIILRANKLGYIIDGTIVRIAPLTALAEEEGQRRKLADEQALAGQLQVVTKTLSYANAGELSPLLRSSVLSQRGTVQIDPRTNTLIITDLPDRIGTASDLIATLDRAQPQVEIEARIVQTNKTFARALGIQWGFTGRVDPALGNTTNLAFPNSGVLSGRGAGLTSGGQPAAVNLPVSGDSGIGLSLGSVNGAFNLDLALSALERTGNGRILSTPRVSTLNNVEAEVTQGVQIPLQTIANNTVTVTFKDAALTLKVTPQITAADTVIMKITLENATPDFSRAAGPAAIPPIDTQRAITTLLVNDGQTTVIGGIYTSNQQNTQDRTPGLGQIPLLSWLFKRDRVSDESRELLIFITPRIIKG
jgi:type IV pilus assembly protein PilQ